MLRERRASAKPPLSLSPPAVHLIIRAPDLQIRMHTAVPQTAAKLSLHLLVQSTCIHTHQRDQANQPVSCKTGRKKAPVTAMHLCHSSPTWRVLKAGPACSPAENVIGKKEPNRELAQERLPVQRDLKHQVKEHRGGEGQDDLNINNEEGTCREREREGERDVFVFERLEVRERERERGTVRVRP